MSSEKNTLSILFLLFSISTLSTYAQKALYEPIEKDKVLLIIGQDLGAIGGFSKPNNDGYVDHIELTPGGITSYTSLPTLGGLKQSTNYGCGDIDAKAIIQNKKFDNSVLVLGLYLVNELKNINRGEYDAIIREMGEWIKATKRPVFLRIGYEFDGEWNHHDPEAYQLAYRRIVNIFRNAYVENCATVWQSTGRFDSTYLMKWYPGDEYVDWVGYSHFDNFGEATLQIARSHNKPVMIAESTPLHLQTDEGMPEDVWNQWFAPFFKQIHDNSDVIRAVAYINADWESQPMWAGQNWGDSRIQENEYIQNKWLEEVSSNFWLNASPSLFQQLNQETW